MSESEGRIYTVKWGDPYPCECGGILLPLSRIICDVAPGFMAYGCSRCDLECRAYLADGSHL